MDAPSGMIASGDWQRDERMQDYRAEWLNDMLVERAAWRADAAPVLLEGMTIAAPGFVWFRFWLSEGERILEKYFDADGNALGMYARIGMSMPRGRGYQALDLILGLWIAHDNKVVVHHEADFEAAVRRGDLSPVEAEHAEHQIREITTAIAHRRFPPPMVRNFAIVLK